MFLVDSQYQGFHTILQIIASQYKKAIRQGDHGATIWSSNGQFVKTPDNAPLDIQHFTESVQPPATTRHNPTLATA